MSDALKGNFVLKSLKKADGTYANTLHFNLNDQLSAPITAFVTAMTVYPLTPSAKAPWCEIVDGGGASMYVKWHNHSHIPETQMVKTDPLLLVHTADGKKIATGLYMMGDRQSDATHALSTALAIEENAEPQPTFEEVLHDLFSSLGGEDEPTRTAAATNPQIKLRLN